MREVNKRQIAIGEATHNPVTVAEAHRALGASSEMLGDWTDARIICERLWRCRLPRATPPA